jgi:hypothetical protein
MNPSMAAFITNLNRQLTESEMLNVDRIIQEMEDRRARIEKSSANGLSTKPAPYRGLLDADFLLEEVNDGSIEDLRVPSGFIPTEELTESVLHPLYLDMVQAESEETEAVEPISIATAKDDQYAKLAAEFGVTDAVADHAYARVRKGNDYFVVVPKDAGKKAVANLDAMEAFEEKYGDDFGPTRVPTRKASDSDEVVRSESGGSYRHRSAHNYRRQKRLPKGGDTIRRDPDLPIKVAAVPNVATIGNVRGVSKAVAERFGVRVIKVCGFSVIG